MWRSAFGFVYVCVPLVVAEGTAAHSLYIPHRIVDHVT